MYKCYRNFLYVGNSWVVGDRGTVINTKGAISIKNPQQKLLTYNYRYLCNKLQRPVSSHLFINWLSAVIGWTCCVSVIQLYKTICCRLGIAILGISYTRFIGDRCRVAFDRLSCMVGNWSSCNMRDIISHWIFNSFMVRVFYILYRPT